MQTSCYMSEYVAENSYCHQICCQTKDVEVHEEVSLEIVVALFHHHLIDEI